jgi:hypothetical protein
VHRTVLTVFLLLLYPLTASAVVVIDQITHGFDAAIGRHAVGPPGRTDQRLAQTFTAGLDGRLVEIEMPLTCQSPGGGTLILDIVELSGDLPGTRIVSRTMLSGLTFVPSHFPSSWHRMTLDTPVRVRPGDRFAIVLSNLTGECALERGVVGNYYSRGEGFFTNNDEPPGTWARLSDRPSINFDYPFVTHVDVPVSTDCHVSGFGMIPIPNFTNVCRCLADPGLREMRCALLNPAFFMIRRFPFPLKENEPFKISWTLVALGTLHGTIEVTDQLPPEFKTQFKPPLIFQASQLPPGGSVTLSYDAVAFGGKKNKFKIDSIIRLPLEKEEGTMRTTIEVQP